METDDPQDPSVPLTDLKPGTPYACCVTPFIVYADDAHDTERDHGSKRPRDATVTVRIPGHGRVALPRSFAEAFITAVPVLDGGDRGEYGSGEVHIHVPEDNVDNEQPVFATTTPRLNGWRVVQRFTPKAPAPPRLIGSNAERRAAAFARAGLALSDLEAVPHAVIPRLVLRHVVGPFVMRLLCTVKQACLGVTALKAGPDFPLAAVPNVTELTLTHLPVAPLPPRTTALAVGKLDRLGGPMPNAPVFLNSACGLTKLELCEQYPASFFDGVPPIPTVRTVTLASLGTSQIAESKLFLQTLAALTPNATALGFRNGPRHAGLLSVAAFFFDQADTMWPLLTELDFGGPAPCAAVMATARPWKVLKLRWEVSVVIGRVDVFTFPDGLAERITAQSRLSASSLQAVSICSARFTSNLPLPELLRFFPPQCRVLKSLILPHCSITLAPGKPKTIVSSFFAGADALEEVRVGGADFGNADGPEDESALLSATFPASVRSVSVDAAALQWTRSVGDPRWVRALRPPPPETAGLPLVTMDNSAHQSQILLVPDNILSLV